VVGLAVLIFGIAENYFLIFKAASKAILVFFGQGFRSVLLLVLALALWKTRFGVGQVALAYLSYAILGTAFVPLVAGAAGYHHKLPSLKYSASVLRRGLPLALQALMIYIYLYADTVMLSVMRTMSEVGHYQAAYRLVTSLNIIGTGFVASVFPFFIQKNAGGRQGLDEIYYRSMKYLLALGFGIAMGTTMLADRIIVFFYGFGFSPSIWFLQILIWSEALIFLSFVCAGLLLALDRRWELFWQAVLAAILNFSLNLPIIYYWGALGASVTTVATEIFALCFLIWRVHRLGIRLGQRWIPDLGRIAGACACMSIILLLGEKLPLMPLIVLGGCAYFGALFSTRFFDDVDIRLGRQILSITRV
jgi:O-antigen/teichoic acid export membrane protein